jgi:hypothetical protein
MEEGCTRSAQAYCLALFGARLHIHRMGNRCGPLTTGLRELHRSCDSAPNGIRCRMDSGSVVRYLGRLFGEDRLPQSGNSSFSKRQAEILDVSFLRLLHPTCYLRWAVEPNFRTATRPVSTPMSNTIPNSIRGCPSDGRDRAFGSFDTTGPAK